MIFRTKRIDGAIKSIVNYSNFQTFTHLDPNSRLKKSKKKVHFSQKHFPRFRSICQFTTLRSRLVNDPSAIDDYESENHLCDFSFHHSQSQSQAHECVLIILKTNNCSKSFFALDRKVGISTAESITRLLRIIELSFFFLTSLIVQYSFQSSVADKVSDGNDSPQIRKTAGREWKTN